MAQTTISRSSIKWKRAFRLGLVVQMCTMLLLRTSEHTQVKLMAKFFMKLASYQSYFVLSCLKLYNTHSSFDLKQVQSAEFEITICCSGNYCNVYTKEFIMRSNKIS